MAIFGIALLVRVIYLVDARDYPALTIPIIDARNYDRSARLWIAGARWPLRMSPQVAIAAPHPPDVEMNAQFFWQPFFYPFFLGCAYFITAGSVLGAKLIQATLGAATCALAGALGVRLFGRAAGIVAGLITAFYGPLIFYDTELLPAGWAALWSVALIHLTLQCHQRRNGWTGLAFGLVGALAVLTRTEFLPFLAAASIWVAWHFLKTPTSRRRRIARCLAIAAGFALPTLAVARANQKVTGHFGFLPAAGGINVYVGNHPDPEKIATAVGLDWDELQRWPQREGITDVHGRQRYFYRQTWAYITEDPLGFLRRLGWKVVQLLCSREIPRGSDVYEVRTWSVLQTVLTWKTAGFGFPFGALLPLALVGLVAHRRKIPMPVVLYLVLYPLAIVLVFVAGRFRLPTVGVLAPLAAAGGLTIGALLRERRWRLLCATCAVMIGVGLLSSLPGPFPLEQKDSEAGLWVGLGHYYQAAGQPQKAVECYQRELTIHPDSVPANTELGRLLLEAGRLDEGLSHFQRAVRAKPHLAATHDNLGLAFWQVGRLAEAEQALRTAIAIEPTWDKLHGDLADLLRVQGRFREAADAYRAALRLAPETYAYYVNLGVSLAELGEYSAAGAALVAGLQLWPDDSRLHFLLGMVLEADGRVHQAVAEYEATLRIQPGHAEARQRLARLLAAPLR